MFFRQFSTLFRFSAHKQLNYYRVLGLEPNSNIQVIKEKYYELAKLYHPDTNTDTDAIKKFIKINEAYQTLSDLKKKKIYDDSFDFKNNDQELYRHKNKKKTAKRQNQYSDPFNQYDDYFKKGSLRNKPKRGQDIYEKIKITLQEAVKGINKKINIKKNYTCTQCDPHSLPKCFACGGKGEVHLYNTHQDETCSKCNGKGYKNSCLTCQGQGFIAQNCQEEVYIPKGTTNSTVLRKQGSGGYGIRHKNGDLYIKIQIQKDDYYKIDGNNIRTINFIPISTAVLGGSINIQTLHGQVQVKIQSGTQSGDQKRLPNYGLPSAYSKRMGDQIISFRVQIPKQINQKELKIFEGLQTLV